MTFGSTYGIQALRKQQKRKSNILKLLLQARKEYKVKGRFEDSDLLMLFPIVWFGRNARIFRV